MNYEKELIPLYIIQRALTVTRARLEKAVNDAPPSHKGLYAEKLLAIYYGMKQIPSEVQAVPFESLPFGLKPCVLGMLAKEKKKQKETEKK